MSRKALGILVDVDAMLLLVWLSGPIQNLAAPQSGLGFGLTAVFNWASISSCSGIRFLAPAKPLLILDSSIQESEPTSPEPPYGTVSVAGGGQISDSDLRHFLDIEKNKEPPELVLSDSGVIPDGRRKCAPTKHSATMASSQPQNAHVRASATPKNSQLAPPCRANLPRALVGSLLARLGPRKFSSPLRHRRNPQLHRPVEEQLTAGFQSGRFVGSD